MTVADRIPISHVGSLPRAAELEAYTQNDIDGIVQKQIDVGFDFVNNGEIGRKSFIGYLSERLSGYEPDRELSPPNWSTTREALAFPKFYGANGGPVVRRHHCVGPIKYVGERLLTADIQHLKSATEKCSALGAFLTAPSPGSIMGFWPKNEYYESDEAYLYALADAVRVEYKAIIDAGFFLQVDDPAICTFYMKHPELSVEEIRRFIALSVECLNYALRDLPTDRIRHHTCYGINVGPRAQDLEMKHVLDLLTNVNAGVYSFEAANPRHEHELALWNDIKLSDGKKLMPGLITNSSILVEHPELVCQRLMRIAGYVGRENVIAGADCGYASSGNAVDDIPEDVVWAKFSALVDGSRMASQALWKN